MDFLYNWLFPQAILYGMTEEQFWYGEPALFHSYGRAFTLQQERKIEYDNYMAWINGQYHLLAIADVFSFKKGSKVYPKKPFDIGNKEDALTSEDKRALRKERAKSMVERFNK